MAHQRPEPEIGTTGTSQAIASLQKAGNRLAVAGRFFTGTLVGFALTGVLFFILLGLWSIVAGPFVRLQSAAFVIVAALTAAVILAVGLYRLVQRRVKGSVDPMNRPEV
jgi:membrane protein implicated in regulation of membrane protease activity